MSKTYNLKEVINKAIIIHNNKYTYGDKENNKITIICNNHYPSYIFKQRIDAHLQGQGCYLCRNNKLSYTLEDFIKKSKLIHNDKYNYIITNYIRMNELIKFTCNIHNTIIQETARNHLRSKKLKCDQCIKEFKNNVKLSNLNKISDKKLHITLINDNKLKSFEDCKLELKNKFNYLDLIEFNGYYNKCIVNDIEYGLYTEIYVSILNGKKHKKRISHDRYLKIKNTLLNKYGVDHYFKLKDSVDKRKLNTYEKYGVISTSQLDWVKVKIKQTCVNKYGVNHQMLNEEIKNKVIQSKFNLGYYHNINGKCLRYYYNNYNNKVSYKHYVKNYVKYGSIALEINFYKNFSRQSMICKQWLLLKEKEIGYKLNYEFKIPGYRIHVDGFDPKTNTVYEFYGDIWHGNLNKFNANDQNPFTKTSYQELYNNTMIREKILLELGYNLITIWEYDFNKSISNNTNE